MRNLQVTPHPFRLGDEARGLEGCGDPRIELDGGVVVVGQLVVSDAAARHHPVLEGRADARVDDVANIASRHLPDLPRDRERVHNFPEAKTEVQDVVHGEMLVLRYGDDLHVVAVNGLKKMK